MRRLLTANVLLAAGLLAATATGQPPNPEPQPKVVPKAVPDKKAADPTDAVIAAALANDPDVKMARAKIQLAEAELAKARQTITLRVVALKAKIDQLNGEVRTAEDRVALTARSVEKGASPPSALLAERDKLGAVKSALGAAEAELKLLTGGAVTAGTDPAADKIWRTWDDLATAEDANKMARMLQYQRAVLLQARAAVKGPIPDRIRAALDKPVKLGAANEKVTFEQAVEAFKKAGLDVPVRAEFKLGPVVSLGEELPVGAWLQLFTDGTPDVRIVVREYGLLVTRKDVAPPDAPSVVEFWKQKPPAKESKPEPNVEPSQKK